MILDSESSKAKDTVTIGAAAEHYVMCQLLRRQFIAALAPKGVPEIDILVTDRGGNSLAEVQVKGRQYSRDGGWMMGEKHETLIRPRLFYCMVDFGEGLNDQPKCWILPSAKMADVLKKSHQAWLDTPGRGGRAHQSSKMRRLTHSYGYESYSLADGWLGEYLDAWSQLGSP
jgi:hypothetical protein